MAVFRYNFYVSGTCRADSGDPTPWFLLENTADSVTENTVDYPSDTTICRYFLRGACTYGPRCRFLHEQRGSGEGDGRNNTDPHALAVASTSEVQSQQPPSSGRDCTERMRGSSSSQRFQGPYPACSRDWVNAPEFIPSKDHSNGAPKSYAQAVNAEAGSSSMPDATEVPYDDRPLCPNMKNKLVCENGDNCIYIHGEVCEHCGLGVLNPHDADQRNVHKMECVRERELKEAMNRSLDKTCGICMEVILEKKSREQRFGILPNCNHCFCLSCIRKWRQAKQFENKIIRACPECRVTSDFVCPSMYWVDKKEEKETLIKDYKQALSVKNCKYFNVGRGKCPFGNKCFYLHAYPDGTKADVGPPVRQRRQNSEGDFGLLQQIILWDFLDDRDNRWLFNNLDDLEDLVAMLSDGSDDSDWSEYDFVFE